MCIGKSPSVPSAPKPDPAPTAVQAADVQATDNGKRKEVRRRGRSSTMTSTDRDTILGQLSGRNTLG